MPGLVQQHLHMLPIVLACMFAYILVPFFFVNDCLDRDYRSSSQGVHGSGQSLSEAPEPFSINGIPVRRISYDWSTALRFFPVDSYASPPSGPPRVFPRVQFHFLDDKATAKARKVNTKRRNAVFSVFKRDWALYRRYAWMQDELKPIAGKPQNPFGGWAATAIDSLDSLWIVGLKSEFNEAVQAVAQIDWARTRSISLNLFETTIRHLGGLLSAHQLSGDPVLLAKAVELGDMLYMAFDTPNHIPAFWLTFAMARQGRQVAGGREPSAAIGTLSMEFSELSRLTGDDKYYDAIDRIRLFFKRTQSQSLLPGMWPLLIDFQNERVGNAIFTLGGGADSLYEYLPKMDLLLAGRDDSWREMALKSLDTALSNLVFRPMTIDQADVLFSGRVTVDKDGVPQIRHQSEHLTCFVGGMFLLSGQIYNQTNYLSVGERLARGCAWAYAQFSTGIMPEVFELLACPRNESYAPDFAACEFKPPTSHPSNSDSSTTTLPNGFSQINDARYIMRPEAIESIFYAYRITGKEEYRDMAWAMWKAIEKATRSRFGHSGIANVHVKKGDKLAYLDSMESVWFAETMKYFYLIFDHPEVMSLDDYVFNTEAHAFPRPAPAPAS
ncbi:Mannosyl-oligosaccharide 1,2-alpha-mannosidase [Ceratocystis fimbriata CBS 114723]|uniref:alpha-1,2-Mannosidase n=1 Tax=Ceratocystis fimbriata CBS 114723 TaxID=1035309 RepID=A0A2C5X9D2_9PEZI|nr:Mannosyl-oligosaccharide 1,2-alpha-mannosidase [Ceratocystis fimbriata CBS 114723]